MKKIIFATAIVCAAAFSQAATISWQLAMGNNIYLPGSTTEKLASGTAYLYDVATVSQADIFSAFLGSGIDTSKAVASTGVTATGGITKKDITGGFVEAASSTYYFVVVDGGNIFVSDAKTITNPGGDKTQSLQFSPKTASQAALITTGAYGGAGWYSAAPEPTSGLLLLLGMAGLALRRRHA